MDFPVALLLCLGIIVGYNAQQTGRNTYCREGEEYYTCRSCEPTCSNVNNGYNNCTQSCYGGCFCRRGLVRAADRTCVAPEDCFLPQCQENEELLDCGSPCEVNCTNMNSEIFCTKPCYRGCFCKADYVRDSTRRCVLPSSCNVEGNQQCGANEQYVNCVSLCNTCWEMNNCRPSFCRPGCDCKPGFYRDYYGLCVSERQCYSTMYGFPNSCGENEEYTNCVNQCNYCNSGTVRCSSNYCEPGCDCKRGYLRNEMGICVLEQNCYSQDCNENELYLSCGPSCRTTCQNYRYIVYDRCRRDCVPGCHCQGNLVLGSDGRCTRPEFCPRVSNDPPCPTSEVFYQCMPTCRTTCLTLNSSSVVCSTACEPGCFCQPGFVRSNNGTCVRPDECYPPPRPTCLPGEVFYECLPCPRSCDAISASIPCNRICRPGCACARGLVKRTDDLCVRPENCALGCDENEEFLLCGPMCPRTCFNVDRPRQCAQGCARGCFCTNGFVFGPDGKCIPPSSCPNRQPPCSTPGSLGIGGRRGGSDDENSTDSSTDAAPSTEQPGNVTTISDAKPDNKNGSVTTIPPTSTLSSTTQQVGSTPAVPVPTTVADAKTETPSSSKKADITTTATSDSQPKPTMIQAAETSKVPEVKKGSEITTSAITSSEEIRKASTVTNAAEVTTSAVTKAAEIKSSVSTEAKLPEVTTIRAMANETETEAKLPEVTTIRAITNPAETSQPATKSEIAPLLTTSVSAVTKSENVLSTNPTT